MRLKIKKRRNRVFFFTISLLSIFVAALILHLAPPTAVINFHPSHRRLFSPHTATHYPTVSWSRCDDRTSPSSSCCQATQHHHDHGAGSSTASVWSKLPKDLLNMISERLDNENDLIRLRSICSHWRSSSIPNHHANILAFKFPLFKCVSPTDTINNNTNVPFCSLSKCSLFLVKRPPQQREQQTLLSPWLIRVTQNSTGKTQLSQSPLLPFDLPSPFQFSLDLNKFSVLHVGTDFIIDFDKGPLPYTYMYPKKVVAVTPLILGILLYNGHLVLLRCGDERWTDMVSSIEDIFVFKGRIYAVEEFSGKTFTIGPEDLSVQLVANKVPGGGDMKFLVENEGELLLVDIDDESFCYDTIFEDALLVHVFMLDGKEKEWVELTSLGNRVLFVGNGCSFSASASDLSVAKGSCIIFMDDVFDILDNPVWDSGMCVFHLDQRQLSPLSDNPDYLNLFWPSPEWIVKS
ncbi:F-box protein SKIP23-like [Trifolium pratense]|uniref:F-box protein SKIP23-like n=1 Tax=Trifolium pratense TaxID=57577 RepID=UPI001E69174B|nr:F-box protein SKIP23-like [Trifolium pratense]